ncbi:hypothetical protein [Conexibacter sp. CPCC 206217]|uniref:DUF4430 domain-containing protein n=1 Tax=Conexibacter sp. CPCC 206217 TaxID=3064574 RepID=UPI00271970C5|nr:hypothetical protein [Conexibacter sp. CPCC 206217]MDO8212198.1 hypothetical protein [Conexibacter sp. CPCC 206217]
MSMKHSGSIRRAALGAACAVAAIAAAPFAAQAADVTVRVEGQTGALLAPTSVTIGSGSGTALTWDGRAMPIRCADDSVYGATEKATVGNWDRNPYVETIIRERHTWSPNEEYWILYHNNDYADWGACDLHLRDGDTVLWQAGKSGPSPDFIPDSVPIQIARVGSGTIRPGGTVTIQLTAWRPTDIFGTPDPSDPNHWIIPPSPSSTPSGYTISGGTSTRTTNASGQATITMPSTAGWATVGASVPGSSSNWSRAVPLRLCVGTSPC